MASIGSRRVRCRGGNERRASPEEIRISAPPLPPTSEARQPLLQRLARSGSLDHSSELLIVWSGNLTDEIPWYLRRFATSWGWLGVMLIVLEFIVPFLLLLSRPLKRNITALCSVVGLIIFMRFVDLMWIVMPAYYQHGFRLSWLNFSVPLALGGLWIAAFVWHLKNRPLLPLQAPNLERALQHGEDE